MTMDRLLVPLYLPGWMHRAVLRFKRAFIPPATNGGQVTAAFTEQFSRFQEQSRLDGRFDPHYVLHTSWAARSLAKTKPEAHVSFGDSLYFVGIVSAFTSTTFCDIRESGLPFRDIEEDPVDLTNLPASWTGTLQSVSCMHVLDNM